MLLAEIIELRWMLFSLKADSAVNRMKKTPVHFPNNLFKEELSNIHMADFSTQVLLLCAGVLRKPILGLSLVV